MRTFIGAVICGTTMVIGHALGFPEWGDFAAGIILGPTLSGPVTTQIWDDSHRRNKRLPR